LAQEKASFVKAFVVFEKYLKRNLEQARKHSHVQKLPPVLILDLKDHQIIFSSVMISPDILILPSLSSSPRMGFK